MKLNFLPTSETNLINEIRFKNLSTKNASTNSKIMITSMKVHLPTVKIAVTPK